MANLPFSFFKQNNNTCEVKDAKAREDIRWKKIGNTVTGSNTIDLTNVDYNELLVHAYYHHIDDKVYEFWGNTLYKFESTYEHIYNIGGGYVSSAGNSNCIVKFGASSDKKINLQSFYLTGTNVTDGAYFEVFYR